MAAKLTHVVDEQTPEDGVRLLSLLIEVLPVGEVEQRVVQVGESPSVLAGADDVPMRRLGRRFRWPIMWGSDPTRCLAHGPDLIYAWGVGATAVVLGRIDVPVLSVISDPAEADPYSRWWRSHGSRTSALHVLCTTRIIQRRLVESGVPVGSTGVVRPGVDFAAIRRAAETVRREDLGLPADSRVLLTASPPSRDGGQYYAIWAAAILHQIWPRLRMLVPGTSREQQRLRRFLDQIYCPEIFTLTYDRCSPAELLAASDMLIVPALGDVQTGWLAWSMAASVPIVGSAVPAVAEFIADGNNGFLCKPGEPHTLASRIYAATHAGDKLRRCVETARSQAFDVFRAQRCVDEHLKIIRNVQANRPPLDRVQDAAVRA